MLIQVIFTDDHHDFVKPGMLGPLIAASKIARFKRGSGWVTVGVDPVRKTHREPMNLTAGDIRKLSSLLKRSG